MTGHRLIAMAVLAVIPLAVVMATPTVRLAQPPPGQYNIEQLWSATLTNPDQQTYAVWLEGKIVEASKGEVFWAQTDSFQLTPGTRVLHYRDVHVAHQRNAPGFEQFAVRTGGLPEGDYTFTVRLMPDFGSSQVEFRVEQPGAPRLISPRDGDTVTVLQPRFVWTPPVPMPGGELDYEIALVEVRQGQTRLDALASNPPWFRLSGIGVPYLTYPVSAKALDPGRTFAWRVKGAFEDGEQERSLGESEVSLFTVQEQLMGRIALSLQSWDTVHSVVLVLVTTTKKTPPLKEVAFSVSATRDTWRLLADDRTPQDGWYALWDTWQLKLKPGEPSGPYYVKAVALGTRGQRFEAEVPVIVRQ